MQNFANLPCEKMAKRATKVERHNTLLDHMLIDFGLVGLVGTTIISGASVVTLVSGDNRLQALSKQLTNTHTQAMKMARRHDWPGN